MTKRWAQVSNTGETRDLNMGMATLTIKTKTVSVLRLAARNFDRLRVHYYAFKGYVQKEQEGHFSKDTHTPYEKKLSNCVEQGRFSWKNDCVYCIKEQYLGQNAIPVFIFYVTDQKVCKNSKNKVLEM